MGPRRGSPSQRRSRRGVVGGGGRGVVIGMQSEPKIKMFKGENVKTDKKAFFGNFVHAYNVF